MPFQASDIVYIKTPFDSNNSNQLTAVAHTYTTGKIYFLVILGIDNTGVGENSVPNQLTTSGVVWSKVDDQIRSSGAITLYKATVLSNTSNVITTVDYPSVQTRKAALLIELDNSNENIIQFIGKGWSGTSNDVTLDNAIGADSIAIMFAASPTDAAGRLYQAGADANETPITPFGSQDIFAQYNIAGDERLDVSTPNGGNYMSIGIEVGFSSIVPQVVITRVHNTASVPGDYTGTGDTNTGSPFKPNDGEVTINSPNITTPQGSGKVILSAINDPLDPGAIEQPVDFWIKGSSVNLDYFDFPVLQDSEESGLFVFVQNDGGVVSEGFNLPIEIGDSQLHTAVFRNSTFTKDVVCQSPSGDFAAGITAIKYPAGVVANAEVSESVVAISVLPTARPQFNCTFLSGPVDDSQGDTTAFQYDKTVGDIESVKGNKKLESGFLLGVTCS